jgi:phage baseplate assembly protein W
MVERKRTDILGRDLSALYRVTDGRHEDLDFDRQSAYVRGAMLRDLTATAGIDNAVQAVIHRLKTHRGELDELGHPDYGSRHHELIGEPNTENNRNLVKLYILQALALEPRIEKILRADILFDRRRAPDRVEIALTLTFIGVQIPQNLVIPFSFAGA